MYKYTFQIKALECEACVKIAKRKIEKIDGVIGVSLDLMGSLEVTADRELTNIDIEQSLENTKYKVV